MSSKHKNIPFVSKNKKISQLLIFNFIQTPFVFINDAFFYCTAYKNEHILSVIKASKLH